MGVIEMVLKDDRVFSVRIHKQEGALKILIVAKGKISGKHMYYECLYSRELIMTNKNKKGIANLILKDLDMQEQHLLSKEKIIKLP